MPRLVRVSFDFDDTADDEFVERYVRDLSFRGFDIWIVTARTSEFKGDVYKYADKNGINKRHIVFTEGDYKWKEIKKIRPIFHVDDDYLEVSYINALTDSVAIYHKFNDRWVEACEKLLGPFKDENGYSISPSKFLGEVPNEKN